MNRNIIIIAAAAVIYAVVQNGCSVEKIEPPLAASPAFITSTTEGAQALASVLQSRDFVITTSDIYKNLGEISLGIMASDPTLANKNTDIACDDGGTYKYDGTATETTYDLTLTFNGCRENKFQYEGTYTIVEGTTSDITINMGSAGQFNIFYFNSTYTVLVAYLKAQSSFKMTGNGTATDAVYTITPTGTVSLFDYFLLEEFRLTYTGMNIRYALTTDPVTRNKTTSILVDGIFLESKPAWALTVTLRGLSIERVKNYSAVTGTFTSDDTSINGELLFNYRPNSYCFEGLYTVVTMTPIRFEYALNRTTQGAVTVNGIATAQYNPGGDLDVTVAGVPVNYAKEYKLMKQCDYAALEENTPPLLGLTGSALGDTMAVTLTWHGPSGSSSDMDLHLKYYNTEAPISSTTHTWHMDWHQGKTYPGATDSCSDPSGLTFSDAFDIEGAHNGTCDVGLDFDDTNGYGPEHITALKLPAGYYVVSVNSYGLHADPSATLYLAIHIGDNIFGPYTTTLTSSDGEGTDPDSWYRVADVRVNADGTVDVLTPNAALTPWHRVN